MNRPELVASCVAPGGQPVLFRLPTGRVPTYVVIDRHGREHLHTSSLGVAMTRGPTGADRTGRGVGPRVGRHLRPHRPAPGRHGHAVVPVDPDHCRNP